jgi:integrase/recombinase XerD
MNEAFYSLLKRELRRRKCSPAIVSAYIQTLSSFASYFHPGHPRQLTETDIRGYLLYLQRSRPLTPEQSRVVLDALRFLYVEIYGIPFRITSVPHPRHGRTPPVLLDRSDFMALIGSIENVKHRALLTLIYSAGLRLGEAVALKPGDIDTGKRVIRVRSMNGKRDHVTPLPDGALEELQFYFKEFKPTKWLFEGQNGGTHLSPGYAEKIFKRAVARAGISMPVKRHLQGDAH